MAETLTARGKDGWMDGIDGDGWVDGWMGWEKKVSEGW